MSAQALKISAGSGGLEPYLKSTAILYCPSDSDKTGGSYGYALNGQNESAIQETATTVLLNETEKRHFDGQNLAYVDGHVKWTKDGGTAAKLSIIPSDYSASGLASNLSSSLLIFADGNSTGSPRYREIGTYSAPITDCNSAAKGASDAVCTIRKSDPITHLILATTGDAGGSGKALTITISGTGTSGSGSVPSSSNGSNAYQGFSITSIGAVGQSFTVLVQGPNGKQEYFFRIVA